MLCPHCGVNFIVQNMVEQIIVPSPKSYSKQIGYKVSGYVCPACNDVILHLAKGGCDYGDYGNMYDGYYMESVHYESMIFPKTITSELSIEIPENYRRDYIEASQVVYISPKASAAIGRRILQEILHSEYGIEKRDLYREIDEFINLPGIPSYLCESVDAIRNIGNFAAHPLKSTQSGQVLDVEDGEAEWILEVLEALFDFTFIQPKRLKERRDKLNAKLLELGKPQMMGTD